LTGYFFFLSGSVNDSPVDVESMNCDDDHNGDGGGDGDDDKMIIGSS